VKIVIILIHGILEVRKQHPEDLQNQKNSNRSGGAHKSRKSDASKQNKNAGTNPFFLKLTIRNTFPT
jgi:hypothetical protein